MNAFENHDSRIRYFELLLERGLDNLPHIPLPEGYRFVFYQPGDRDAWIRIEQSAREFSDFRQGLEAWERYYGGREDTLLSRMAFVEDERGEKAATATAYYDARDPSGSGWLHWVAVRREYQGKGLSKPLIVHALSILRRLGYTRAKIPTQTTTWLAVKIYLDLGFLPIPQNAVNSRDGWRIIRALTNHPALSGFTPAQAEEICENTGGAPASSEEPDFQS